MPPRLRRARDRGAAPPSASPAEVARAIGPGAAGGAGEALTGQR